MDNKPDVYIETDALRKLNAYFKYADRQEICGLGSVEIEEGQLVVRDVILFEQEVTSGEANFDRDALAKWNFDLIRSGQDPSLYRFMWHKHPITGWSQIDNKCIEDMNNGEWLLSCVKQSNGVLLWRLDLYQPFRITLDNLTYYELRDSDPELDTNCKAEVLAKVKQKVYVPSAVMTSYRSYNELGGTWKDGVWHYDPDKKNNQLALPNTSPNGSNTNPTNTDAHDKFFEEMADEDWESYYNWDAVQLRNKMYGRFSE